MLVITFVLSGLIASGVGATGDVWIWITVLGVYPLIVVVHFVTAQFFAPDIEPTGDYRRVLFDNDADERHLEKRDGKESEHD